MRACHAGQSRQVSLHTQEAAAALRFACGTNSCQKQCTFSAPIRSEPRANPTSECLMSSSFFHAEAGRITLKQTSIRSRSLSHPCLQLFLMMAAVLSYQNVYLFA